MENDENMIEFTKGSRTCTVSFTSPRYVKKMKKIYEKSKEEFDYFVENKDGSVCAKIPLKWIKISSQKREPREMTEEDKEELRERLKLARDVRLGRIAAENTDIDE